MNGRLEQVDIHLRCGSVEEMAQSLIVASAVLPEGRPVLVPFTRDSARAFGRALERLLVEDQAAVQAAAQIAALRAEIAGLQVGRVAALSRRSIWFARSFYLRWGVLSIYLLLLLAAGLSVADSEPMLAVLP